MSKSSTFRSLLNGNHRAEIVCPFKKKVVRKLATFFNDMVAIDGLEGPVALVSLDTPISYEPWFMDRGSLLFNDPKLGTLKLCTESDLIRYPDGSEEWIEAPGS